MVHGRLYSTATLLTNGQVLVVGGWSREFGFLAVAELYDPATGAFTQTGSLHSARYRHTATLLNNGQVLIAGGENTSALSSAEL